MCLVLCCDCVAFVLCLSCVVFMLSVRYSCCVCVVRVEFVMRVCWRFLCCVVLL